MKIPLNIDCDECGHQRIVYINLDDTSFDSVCDCGSDLSGYFDSTVTTGVKLLWRCRFEIMDTKDYPLSIVFAATSVDCELSRLFFKWREIEQIDSELEITDEELEKQLRDFANIKSKINEVTKLMSPEGITSFVQKDNELKKTIETGFPSLDVNNLPKSFQEKLFWPRNRILHLGDSNYGSAEAIRCFNIATLGLKILGRLDEERRNC